MKSGMLILVGTPIGNLGDMTVRGVEALRSADLIACEDTRVTRKLLSHFKITAKQLLAVPSHAEGPAAERIVTELNEGRTVALVTDAGMPAVSDPGEQVVAAAVAGKHTVTVIPGPTAVTAAIAISGLPATRFSFEGFLPRSGKERRQRLEKIAQKRRLAVFYESPHRLQKTLADLATLCQPARRLVVCRELTKLHEEIWRGTITEAVATAFKPKGEFVVAVEGVDEAPTDITDEEITTLVQNQLTSGASVSSAARAVATEVGVSRDRVYAIALALQK